MEVNGTLIVGVAAWSVHMLVNWSFQQQPWRVRVFLEISISHPPTSTEAK